MAETPPAKRELLITFLADSDARCPSCRYALRGCTSDKCPECGCELALAIDMAGGRTSTWWFAAIGGCALSTLLALLLLVFLLDNVAAVLRNPLLPQNVRSGFSSASELPQWSRLLVVLAIDLLFVLLLAWLVARRRAFGEWSRQRRAWIGMLCWLSPAIVLAFIAWLTR